MTDKNIEEAVAKGDFRFCDDKDLFLYSIAVSMKRIADAIAGPVTNKNLIARTFRAWLKR